MGTNWDPFLADLFLLCYEREFKLSLSDNNQADIVEAFNSTSRYQDDLLNIDKPNFELMVKVSKGAKIRNRYNKYHT